MINKALSFSGFLLKGNPFLLNRLINYKSNSLRIVYYHMVSKNEYPFYFDNKAISIDEFKEQLTFFKKQFDIINMSDAIDLAKDKKSLKRKLVITFDDGFTDNYTVAAPILKEFNCSATFYLIGNCIDNKDLMWRNKLLLISKTDTTVLKKEISKVAKRYKLSLDGYKSLMKWSSKAIPMDKKDEIVNALWENTMSVSIEEFLEKHKPYMSSKQILELFNEGFEFGIHSMSHPNFNNLTYKEFKDEILNSKEIIENIIQKDTTTFTYPFGQRSSSTFEKQLLDECPGAITAFLGTRNKLKNTADALLSWERDNMEHPFEIALSRFLLVSTIRSLK